MAAPLYYASASIDRPLGLTTKRLHQSCLQAREVCSAALGFPARWAGYARTNWLGHRYRWSRIDAAIAHSLLEQHSRLGSSPSGNRNDGEGRLVRVAWPFNCNCCLGLHLSDLCVRYWRFPEAFGFFSGLMRLDFITALTSRTPVSTSQWLCGTYLGYGTLFRRFKI